MAIAPRDPNEKIDDLERDLYSRDAEPITTKNRPELSPHEKLVQYGWKEDEAAFNNEIVEMQQTDRKRSFATKIFMASVLFFVVSAGIAAYIILGGFNIISSKNVDISVQGLVAVSAGEEVLLDIIVKNNNNSALDSGTIYIEYPEGTRMAEDVTKELLRGQIDFGEITAGGSVTKTIKPVLFGEKDSVKQIKISVNYKARGSNAVFSKEKTFDITIKSSPVIMTINVPQEVNAGQDIEIKIDVASNSNTLIRDLLVRAEYPFGFTFVGANPPPAFDTNVWRIGDLNPKDKHTLVVKGRMEGQNEEERTFRFATGTAGPTDEKQIAVGYITAQQSLFIKKPFIGLSLQLNGRPQERIISAGERVQGILLWSNNLPVAINDATIQVKLSGKGLDRNQVSASAGGFFRSFDNTITWDKNSMPILRSIEPSESGSVSFSFSALPASPQLLAQGRNMDIVLGAKVTGVRVQSGAPQEIKSEVSGLAKIGTNLTINARTLYSIGPFANTGPVPPRAERETTYTVVLNVSNSFNDVADVVLATQLPPYVRWLGKINPSTEQVSYDESTRTVFWSIPDLRAGVGYTSSSKEAAFQISFLPSLSQVGTTPELTGSLSAIGTDRFTGSPIESEKSALTTRLNNDPEFRSGDDRVVE
ncbi:MAG: hypothetical protein AAB635_00270 [Patescibacteria group bacterium]